MPARDRWDNVYTVSEQDYPSGLEEPDAEAGDTTPAEPDVEPEDTPREGSSLEQIEPDEVWVKRGSRRRRPKYGVFGFLGGLIGFIVAMVLARVGTIPMEQDYTRTDLSIVLVGLGVPLGILLAMVIALLLDRRR